MPKDALPKMSMYISGISRYVGLLSILSACNCNFLFNTEQSRHDYSTAAIAQHLFSHLYNVRESEKIVCAAAAIDWLRSGCLVATYRMKNLELLTF